MTTEFYQLREPITRLRLNGQLAGTLVIRGDEVHDIIGMFAGDSVGYRYVGPKGSRFNWTTPPIEGQQLITEYNELYIVKPEDLK